MLEARYRSQITIVARLDPFQHLRTELEAIGDVQQLQRVGLVVTLALQRVADLGADRGGVFRERQELARVAFGARTPRAAPPASACRSDRGLRRPCTCPQLRHLRLALERQHFVERLAAAHHAPRRAIDQHFGRAAAAAGSSRPMPAPYAPRRARRRRRRLRPAETRDRAHRRPCSRRSGRRCPRHSARRRGEQAARCGGRRCRARAASARSCRHRARRSASRRGTA